MTQSYELAQAYVTALTGHPDTVMDWRCINDTDKGVPAHTFRGSLAEMYQKLVDYNNAGWGIFACINAMDGQGRELPNVQAIRTHVIDLDNPLSSEANYARAVATYPQPHFAVQTSPGKYHVYWLVEPYTGNEFYAHQQRKLAQIYDGDKSIIDPTRVLRIPGFLHLKAAPFLVTIWGIQSGPRHNYQIIEQSLAAVNIIAHFGSRAQLGDAEMAAPSIDWLRFALYLLNPNELDRQEWLSITAAFKQAGWTLADEQTLITMWQTWCSQYGENDPLGENLKLWHSIRDTEVGWKTFIHRTTVQAYIKFGANPKAVQSGVVAQPVQERVVGGNNEVGGSNPSHTTTAPVSRKKTYNFPELLSIDECAIWFENCYFIGRTGEIFSPEGRYMNQNKFNGLYGGKHFIITGAGKSADDPWKAALRSTGYTIPKVDHIRFIPDKPPYTIVTDRMGRKGLNTYIPVIYDAKQGDISLWLDFMNRIMPNETDRHIWFAYLAHCVKYPGSKIPWAPLLQSAEGIGKTVFAQVMEHALGDMYIYSPKANELVASGSKFNAWMRSKLCIIVNEIKVDERRELIEILKPMITDARVEVQAKGSDQEMEDNLANWIFFSNHKDAIPVSQNGRRYCIFFSPLQSARDIIDAGMDDNYFSTLFDWLKYEGGFQAVTYWLLNYPIEKGKLPVRAPKTSSFDEALRISRSPMEVVIEEAVEDAVPGFRGGFVSSLAVIKRVTATGIKSPSGNSIRTVLQHMGYRELGRALAPYPYEDLNTRSIIYCQSNSNLRLEDFARAQGYESMMGA